MRKIILLLALISVLLVSCTQVYDDNNYTKNEVNYTLALCHLDQINPDEIPNLKCYDKEELGPIRCILYEAPEDHCMMYLGCDDEGNLEVDDKVYDCVTEMRSCDNIEDDINFFDCIDEVKEKHRK